jgi:hypothetical protein
MPLGADVADRADPSSHDAEKLARVLLGLARTT